MASGREKETSTKKEEEREKKKSKREREWVEKKETCTYFSCEMFSDGVFFFLIVRVLQLAEQRRLYWIIHLGTDVIDKPSGL